MMWCVFCFFFFSSRRRHTICALVTGVDVCSSDLWLRIVPQPPTYEGCPDMSYDRTSGLYLADMDFGAIVGSVTLIDCLPIEDIASGAADERYPWIRAHEHSERSEERRVGKECVSTCRSRWAP